MQATAVFHSGFHKIDSSLFIICVGEKLERGHYCVVDLPQKVDLVGELVQFSFQLHFVHVCRVGVLRSRKDGRQNNQCSVSHTNEYCVT